MRIIIIVYVLSTGFALCGQNIETEKVIIKEFLLQPNITEVLKLNDTIDRSAVRIIDTSHTIRADAFCFLEFPMLAIYVYDDIPINLNTGFKRDIVISRLTRRKGVYVLEAFFSVHRSTAKIKERLHCKLEFTIINNQMNIINEYY